jgi:hypothetical protein
LLVVLATAVVLKEVVSSFLTTTNVPFILQFGPPLSKLGPEYTKVPLSLNLPGFETRKLLNRPLSYLKFFE